MTDLPTDAVDRWGAFQRALQSESRFGLELGLDRIERALDLEGRPDRQSRTVVVAGTNGKGETAAFLDGILGAHGLRTGLFTSPHLVDLRERFRVDGDPLGRTRVAETGGRILDEYGASSADPPRLTYFELTFLIGATLFADVDVDLSIYEVGLGGRLDAVNATSPALGVVTNIGRDHRELLGPTLSDIAEEKAAVLRRNRPAVIGYQTHDEALDVLHDAPSSRTMRYGQDYGGDDGDLVLDETTRLEGLLTDMPVTRRWNVAAAAMAARQLLGSDVDERRVRRGVRATRWPGRLDRLSVGGQGAKFPDQSLELVVDAAHNPDAARQLFEQLDDESIGAAVCGGLSDKTLGDVFEPVRDQGLPRWGAVLDADRGANADELAEVLAGDSFRGTGRTGDVLARAATDTAENERVLVYGSTYLVGEAFRALGLGDRALSTRKPSTELEVDETEREEPDE
ncbi:MAG: folylpolyglutamate synthase/dihydrofolate synthase family protein [Bradymonadaceae bacterium]